MATENTQRKWTTTQKVAFRIFFLYLLLLCIPTYWGFYEHLLKLEFSKITYHDTQSIVAFWPPQWITIETEEGIFGLLNYINLLFVFGIAAVGGLIWTALDRKSVQYDQLYYWIRVLARYRLAYGMIGWGLKKIFPMQMVIPTVGMLNTPFLDFAEKKLYWSHVGIEPAYTVFLGFAEFVPGLLLLHRKTAVLGAALAAVVTFNICIANHAFDAGVGVPAAYFAIIGTFIAWFHLPRIWQVVVLQKDVIPFNYYPAFAKKWQQYARTGLKLVGNGIFVVGATFLWWYGWQNNHNNYNIPNTPGLQASRGFYQVTTFKVNNVELPYSPYDTLRWQDATFETWSSLSYKTNRGAVADRMIGYSPLRVKGDTSNQKLNQVASQDSDLLSKQKKKRDLGVTRWEIGGMAGDRHYFYYDADTVNQILYLQNKNKAYKNERQVLHYSRPTPDRIILEGLNEFSDSIYVVLDRVDKKYPLVEGRQAQVAVY